MIYDTRHDVRKHFGRNLAILLHSRGMSQSDLARALFKRKQKTRYRYFGAQQVNHWINGRCLAKPETREKIARILGVKADDLIQETLSPKGVHAVLLPNGKWHLRVDAIVPGEIVTRVKIALRSERQ